MSDSHYQNVTIYNVVKQTKCQPLYTPLQLTTRSFLLSHVISHFYHYIQGQTLSLPHVIHFYYYIQGQTLPLPHVIHFYHYIQGQTLPLPHVIHFYYYTQYLTLPPVIHFYYYTQYFTLPPPHVVHFLSLHTRSYTSTTTSKNVHFDVLFHFSHL